ncbi:hypothetical protein FQN57_004313 [Myotisia sp. PD_48]|nr:hypothetical protein FQN57_004313 [Myotisia sp. PD_48]
MPRIGVIGGLIAVLVGAILVLQLSLNLHQPQTLRALSSFTPNKDWPGRPSPKAAGENENDVFIIGTGKADITGPVVEINLMGYANLSQVGSGLRQRLYSRTFLVENPNKREDCVIYIVLDAHSGDVAVRNGVLDALAAMGPEYSRYAAHNVAITGTHSHSGPGAWLNYLLPQITNLGFNKESYQAIVDGVVLSIRRAHGSRGPGRLSFDSAELEDGNINRSPFSYLANPEDERKRYPSNVDKTLSLLRFDRVRDKKTIGVLTFYSVHGTSLFGNNTLVSGDNKGVAAYLFERSVQNDSRFADNFVAGFSQSSVGDTSPNVNGATCEDTGEKCKFEDSTCGGKSGLCHGQGPFYGGIDKGTKSCFEIGRRQFSTARSLYDKMDKSTRIIQGNSAVKSFHVYRDLSDFSFRSPFDARKTLTTCSAALGFSFAAGTTDGPGVFDFTQNGTDAPSQSNPLWYVVRGVLHDPSKEQIACQHPKTILLDVGSVNTPYAWAPNVIDFQLLRIGSLIIIVSSPESTTMAGRRWKEKISKAAKEVLSINEPLVVLGGPANTYSHYVSTEEEYNVQRYEGASTLHGPHTLAAHINVTVSLLPYLASTSNTRPSPGLMPPVNTNKSLSFIQPVVLDRPPMFQAFGDVVTPPESKTFRPGDIVQTKFVGANPRNNYRQERTFAAVERQVGASNNWEVVRTDADWNLVYNWARKSTVLGTSEVTIEWQIEDAYYSVADPRKLESGTYRLRYYGDSRSMAGEITAFEGIGPPFKVSV